MCFPNKRKEEERAEHAMSYNLIIIRCPLTGQKYYVPNRPDLQLQIKNAQTATVEHLLFAPARETLVNYLYASPQVRSQLWERIRDDYERWYCEVTARLPSPDMARGKMRLKKNILQWLAARERAWYSVGKDSAELDAWIVWHRSLQIGKPKVLFGYPQRTEMLERH